jgi:hypothetical protein
VGKSVRRNRLKRLVKESYRSLEPHLRKGCKFVFVLKPPPQQAVAQAPCENHRAPASQASLRGLPSYADILGDVSEMLARAGAYVPAGGPASILVNRSAIGR